MPPPARTAFHSASCIIAYLGINSEPVRQFAGEAQVVQGLLQSLGNPLSLAPIALEALLSFEAARLSSFHLWFDISFAGGHGNFLRSVAGLPLRHVLPYFLLSFAGHLRYTWALTASAILASSSARLMHA
jgi:hypothetical protein